MFARMIALAVIAVAVVLVGGCTDIGAVRSQREDSRDFPLTGNKVVIRNSSAELRIVPGAAGPVRVRRTLTGKATVDGNATWAAEGDVLRLGVVCSGFVPDCGGLHVVEVPPGTAVEVDSDASVRAAAFPGDLTATVRHGWLRVEDPAGVLNLSCRTANLVVTGARSVDVTATADQGDVTLSFSAAPTRVVARAGRTADITLPRGEETYHVTAPGSAVADDPASPRSVVASGDTATRLRKAG